MSNNQENVYDVEERERKTIGEIVSKILTVICAVAAIALIGVTVFALISANKEETPDTGSVAPGVADTSTTQPTSAGSDTSASESDTSASGSDTTGAQSTSEQSSTSTTKADEQTDERKVIKLEIKHWPVVVVDKDRQIPEGYVPELEYVADSDCALDSRIAKYYDEMYNAALEDGVELTPYSGYRSYEVQDRNYKTLVSDYALQGLSQEEAEEKAATEILPAGSSEHNLGFAMDICGTQESFRDTDEYKWLTENAYKYGFIERYPEGKQDITGVIPEPWHWRFIGPAYAKDMKERGAETLEEYLQSYNANY